MQRITRPWLVIGLLALNVAPVAAQEPKGAAATVNGQPIPEIAVQRALRRIPPAQQEQARKEILNYLIENALIDQYLETMPNPVGQKEVDERMAQIQAEIKKEGQDFARVLQELMLTEDELRKQLMADMRWEKYASGRATEQALRDLFDKDRAIFDGSMVRARHILLAGDDPKTKEQLQQVRKQIEDSVAAGLAKLPANTDEKTRQGERARLVTEAFAARAKEVSACPSKEQGGDLGFFPRMGAMVEPFAGVAFSLQPNQVSDVVTTQFGHHLILVTERRPGREIKFEDVKQDVRAVFFEKLRDNLAAQLQQKAKIVIHPAPKP